MSLSFSNCFIVAPNVFRLESKETIAIFVEGNFQHVQVSLENHPHSRGKFFDQSKLVKPGKRNICVLRKLQRVFNFYFWELKNLKLWYRRDQNAVSHRCVSQVWLTFSLILKLPNTLPQPTFYQLEPWLGQAKFCWRQELPEKAKKSDWFLFFFF